MASTDTESTRDWRSLTVAGILIAACGGLVLYGVLDTADTPAEPHVPTAAVTYEVTGDGTADIAYQGRSEAGSATVDEFIAPRQGIAAWTSARGPAGT